MAIATKTHRQLKIMPIIDKNWHYSVLVCQTLRLSSLSMLSFQTNSQKDYVTFLLIFLYPLPTQLISTPPSSPSGRNRNTIPIISRSNRSISPSSTHHAPTPTVVVVSGPVRILLTSSGENAIKSTASG